MQEGEAREGTGKGRGEETGEEAREVADWSSIVAILVGISAFGLALGLTYPLVSLLLAGRGISDGIIGLNAAAMFVGQAVATLSLPWFSARIAPARLIIVGLVIAAFSVLSLAATDDLTIWFLCRFTLGFGINQVFVLGEVWLNVACPDRLRGRVASAYETSLAGGFALGPLGIPLFGEAHGLALASGAVLLAAAAFLFALLSRRSSLVIHAAPKGSIGRFARTAPVLIALVATFAFFDATALSVLPVYLLGEGMTAGGAALAVTVLHLGMIASQPPLGYALDRLPRLSVAAAAAFASAIGIALVGLLPGNGWAIWIVLPILGGTALGLYTCALTLLGQHYHGPQLMAGSAAFGLAYAVGGGLGPLIAGGMMEYPGPDFMPYIFTVTFLGLAVWLVLRQTRLR
ncbi:MAG: MFS transporter [Kiloniellales bacterium]